MRLILKTDNKTIGIVRNPFEKVVSDYYASLNYIGFEKWITKQTPEYQTLLYKNCDYIVRLERLEYDLKDLDIQPKDTSILRSVKVIHDWKSWYTLNTRTIVAGLYHNDIITYGYTC